MRALSIRQPWAFAVLFLGKDVENRRWSSRYRGPVLVHAPATVDQRAVAALRREGFDIPVGLPTRGYLGIVQLTGCRRASLEELWQRPGANRWAEGPWCFELRDPYPFPEPIPGQGALGLYSPEPNVLIQVQKILAVRSGEGVCDM